jgi:hypothetical protein
MKGKGAGGPVEDDEPTTEEVDGVMEAVGIRDTVDGCVYGEREKGDVGYVADPTVMR